MYASFSEHSDIYYLTQNGADNKFPEVPLRQFRKEKLFLKKHAPSIQDSVQPKCKFTEDIGSPKYKIHYQSDRLKKPELLWHTNTKNLII